MTTYTNAYSPFDRELKDLIRDAHEAAATREYSELRFSWTGPAGPSWNGELLEVSREILVHFADPAEPPA